MLNQLTEQDASYLYMETAETPQSVACVILVELPQGYCGDFYEDYKKHIAQRMHLAPLLGLKLMPLPFDLDHPFWVEDDKLDITYHIRRLSLPNPGRIADLEALVGRLHSNFLDRSRPLWEFYVIDGLEDGRVALYTKFHHSCMDGASSKALVAALYDPAPAGRVIPPPPNPVPMDGKALLDEMLKGVAAHLVRQEIRAIQFVPEVLKAWAKLALPDPETLEFTRAPKPLPRTPKTLFNVGITSQRAYAMRSLPLTTMKRIAKQTQCKLNDIVLAVCSGALRRYLLEKDALPAKTMTALVPVALAQPGGELAANHNTIYLCSLATDIADPYARLIAIRESSLAQKTLLGNIKNALAPDLSGIGSGILMRAMVDLYCRARIADRMPPLANLVISNLAISPVPLYVAGAKMLTYNPCSIPFHGMALNITVHSYCDSMDFGLIACRHAVPDLGKFADYLETELDELETAVARTIEKTAARSRPARGAAAMASAPEEQRAAKTKIAVANSAGDSPPRAVATAKVATQRKLKVKRGTAPAKRASANPAREEMSAPSRSKTSRR